MPGSGPFQDPPGPGPDPAAIAARLDEIAGPAAEFEQRLFAHMDERIAAQSGQVRAITDRLEGAVGSQLGVLEDKAAKIGTKLVKNANRQLGQAYTYMYPFGGVYPTNEQALQGLQSGDYLGTMGVAVPADSVSGGTGNDLPAPAVGVRSALAPAPDLTVVPSEAARAVLPPVAPAPPPGPAPVAVPPVQPPVPLNPPPDPGFQPIPPPFTTPGGVLRVPPGSRPPPDVWPTGPDGRPMKACAVSVTPQMQPLSYPCPFPYVINPSNPAAPWGYAPNSGQALCWDGSIPAHLGLDSCPPQTTGTGSTPPPPVPPPPPPTSPPPVCPPGTHPNPNPGPPAVLYDVPVLAETDDGFSARGNVCSAAVNLASDPNVAADPWQMVAGEALFRALPYYPTDPVPTYPADWDVVTIHHWLITPGGGTYQDFVVRVPHGFSVFTHDVTGILYALPVVPPYGCRVREVRRQTWVGGGPPCVTDPAPVPAVCPVPDVAHCGPELKGKLGPLTADEDNVCKAIADAIDKIKGQNVQVADWIGMRTGDNTDDSTATAIMKAVLGLKNPIISDLVNRFAGWIQEFLKRGTNALGCDQAAMLPLILNRGVFRFINQWTGAVPAQLLTELDQLSHTVCQSLLPSVSEADRAYLADAIDQSLWECWVKAAGAHLKDAQAVRDAGRERLDARQAIESYRKKFITEERYRKLMRQAGVLSDDERYELFQAQLYWPNHTDIIQWMGKDAFDEETVETFGLDTDFDAKYTARAQEFGDGLGMDVEQARYHWRSHWRNIGPQTMIEGARRLRPGDVDAAIAVSPEDLRKALLQQDIQPYWVDRMIELGFRVVTREDAVRLYTLHQIEKDELVKLLQDAGFKRDRARQLADYYETVRTINEVKASGVPTVRMAVRRYARGEMTSNELSDLAGQLAYYPGQVEQIEQAAELAREMENRRLAIAGVKRRYTKGLIGPADAAAELAGEGIEADEIQELMKWWDQVKRHAGKQVPAATICTWRKSHLIGASEQLAALMRLGYDAADANHITAQCTLDIANAAQRAQVKAEQQAMRAATQAAKSEAARAKAQVRSNRTSAPAVNGASANGAAGP